MHLCQLVEFPKMFHPQVPKPLVIPYEFLLQFGEIGIAFMHQSQIVYGLGPESTSGESSLAQLAMAVILVVILGIIAFCHPL